MPSYSSGVIMPRKPSLPISSMTSRGKYLVRSHSAAYGSIFSRANSRASSTTWRCVSVSDSISIDIESHAGFAAESPGRHHLAEQPRGLVFHVTKAFLQHFEDRETDIEADQVGERERSQRMLHPERHHLIDGLGRRDAFLHAQNRLVDHRHQHAVRDKAGRVVHFDRRLAEFLGNLHHATHRIRVRIESLHDLHQRHYRYPIHEMHADDTSLTAGGLRAPGG